VRNMQPQVAEFLAQSLPGDPQQAGRLVLIAVRILHDAGQQEPVKLAVHFRVIRNPAPGVLFRLDQTQARLRHWTLAGSPRPWPGRPPAAREPEKGAERGGGPWTWHGHPEHRHQTVVTVGQHRHQTVVRPGCGGPGVWSCFRESGESGESGTLLNAVKDTVINNFPTFQDSGIAR